MAAPAEKGAEAEKVEEYQFLPDDVSNIIKESVDQVLQNQQYDPNKVRARTRGDTV